jgi:hypothetical protein
MWDAVLKMEHARFGVFTVMKIEVLVFWMVQYTLYDATTQKITT